MLQRYPVYALADVTVPTRDERKEIIAAEVTEAIVRRLFRRHAGTPVAGLCLLVLLWLDHLRLRAALAVARSFGMARAA